MFKLAPTTVRDRFVACHGIQPGKVTEKLKMIWVDTSWAGKLPSTFEDHLIVYFPF